MPANMLVAITPIISRVTWALRALGGRRAGTPLAIASTPVSAVQPDENARSATKPSASKPSEPYPGCTRTP